MRAPSHRPPPRRASLSTPRFALVPSPVKNLRLSARYGLPDAIGGLLASWTPGDGDLDMYMASLSKTVRPVQAGNEREYPSRRSA